MTNADEPNPAETFRTPDVHEKISIQLGRLITRWGWLEAIVEDIIAGLLGTETALLYPITADISIGTRLKHLKLLAKLRLGDPAELVKLNRVVSRVEKLCGWRNQIVHGLWYREDDESEIALVLETRPNKDAVVRSVGQYFNEMWIVYLIVETARCTQALWRFGKSYNLILPPLESSQQKPP